MSTRAHSYRGNSHDVKQNGELIGQSGRLNVQSPYKRGGTGTGNSYFYTVCTFLMFGALPVVKDAQTKWRPCNETTAKR